MADATLNLAWKQLECLPQQIKVFGAHENQCSEPVKSKLESINAVARVKMLGQDQVKSKFQRMPKFRRMPFKICMMAFKHWILFLKKVRPLVIGLRITMMINTRIYKINYCTRRFINTARIFIFLVQKRRPVHSLRILCASAGDSAKKNLAN